MNESLQIRKAGNMISTSVLSRIDPVDFVDTFCCRITAERDIRPADVLITMFTNYPQWVEALMKLRNCLVEPFGLKGGKGPEVAEYHKIISDFAIAHPDMTREDINKLYCNLAREYGKAVNDQDIQELYSWVDITHLFMQPCYYLGYGTSAFTSLDLFALAGEDREAAVDKYLELTAVSAETPYCEAVQKVGLRDIFEKGVPGEILKEVNNRLKKDYEQ